MKVLVDLPRRLAKQRAHTATHLLHAELQKYFPYTKQEGSFVWEDELRFDFAADKLLSNDEIEQITSSINKQIQQAYVVQTQTMPYIDAVKMWAKAFFADTYGTEVRVVSIKQEWQLKQFLSLELCGWNHVQNTGEIGAFVIMRQEAVASWVKRLQAYTGPRVLEKVQQDNAILSNITNVLSLKQYSQLPEKIEKTLKDYQELQSSQQSLKQAILQLIDANIGFNTPIALNTITAQYTALIDQDIIQYLESSDTYKNKSWIAYNNQPDGTSIVTIYDPINNSAKTQAATLWIRGWWSDKKVTGKLATHFNLL